VAQQDAEIAHRASRFAFDARSSQLVVRERDNSHERNRMTHQYRVTLAAQPIDAPLRNARRRASVCIREP
jgi:hypothetical protein